MAKYKAGSIEPGSAVAAVLNYERWMRKQVRVVEADLGEKREKLAENAFVFLRGSFFRWVETVEERCAEIADTPVVAAIGDIHLENFGVWRDEEGRLGWGVNDFDEAARMPYAYDLVRLATSAILALKRVRGADAKACRSILDGYAKRLGKPRPFVLDEKNAWMRRMAMSSEAERADFWADIDRTKKRKGAPARFRKLLKSAIPKDAKALWFAPREAGVGSLGRRRYIVVAKWRGGRIVREAKDLAPSAWTIRSGFRRAQSRCAALARVAYTAGDPFYKAGRHVVVRRLAPDSDKLTLKRKSRAVLLSVLGAMGGEIANVHAASRKAVPAIERDLARRGSGWLVRAARVMAKQTREDHAAWRKWQQEN